MKALLIDKLPLNHKEEKDHFFFQEGNEPSKLNGQLILKNKDVEEELIGLKKELIGLKELILGKPAPKLKPAVFRLENLHGVPENSGDNIGRLIFNTIDEKIHCDLGYKFKRISSEKFEKDFVAHDPAEKLIIDLSESDIDDARKCLWQVCDNANDFERVNCKIKTPNEKTVVIEFPLGLSLGTFRVLGME